MKIRITLILFISIILYPFFSFKAAFAENTNSVQRFAIIAGSNYGGIKRDQLKYAVSDACSIAKVFKELGGLQDNNIILLQEPDPQKFVSAFNNLNNIIKQKKAAGRRIESIFYYSGHSDEKGLILNGGQVPYEELKENIRRLNADIKIAIIDSCSSGTLIRIKGGERLKPFLLDNSVNLKGYAILSSSSDAEASQESDRLRGSFFTHCLISGLRGAADIDGNNKVTLNEAYLYSYYEISSMTKNLKTAPQHPGYDIQMKGAGDLVLTDIENSNSSLTIDAGIIGHVFIYDGHGGFVAELNNNYKSVTLGLFPDQYKIKWNNNGEYYQAKAELKAGEHIIIDENKFSVIKDNDLPKSSFALRNVTFIAAPFYSTIYSDLKSDIEPSVGVQLLGNFVLNNFILNPVGIIGLQKKKADNLSIYYMSAGTAMHFKLTNRIDFSLICTIGFSNGNFDLKREYGKDARINYSQPIFLPGISIKLFFKQSIFSILICPKQIFHR